MQTTKLTCWTAVLLTVAYAQVKHTEHFVQLGDSWSVECNTPYKEPPSWYFMRAGGGYHYYIYTYGRLEPQIKSKYKVTLSKNGQISTLEVSRTDKDHAGYYGCWPDPTSLDERQFYKLILIENSSIEFVMNENQSLILNMNISYLGVEAPIPEFQCTFSFGDQVMDGKTCGISNTKYSVCKLQQLFDLNDDIPYKCDIVFNNVNHKKCNEKNLFIEPKTKVMVINKGTSWNVRCNTTSYYSMMWLFHSFKSNNGSIVLYSKWTPNEQYYDRYHFNVSNDRRVYDMIIPRVDLNHSGTYMCTHKSSDRLIEKKIDLIVVDQTLIGILENLNLIMLINYIGNNKNNPIFQCNHNNDTWNITNVNFKLTKNNLTTCQHIEIYENANDIPDKCYILFENQVYTSERSFTIITSSSTQSECSPNIERIVFITALLFITIVGAMAYVIKKSPNKFIKIKRMLSSTKKQKLTSPRSIVKRVHKTSEQINLLSKSYSVCQDTPFEIDMNIGKKFEDDANNFNTSTPIQIQKRRCTSFQETDSKATKSYMANKSFLGMHGTCPSRGNTNASPLENEIEKSDDQNNSYENSNSIYLIEYKSYKNQDLEDKGMDLEVKIMTNNNIELRKVHKKVISECFPTINKQLQKNVSDNQVDLTMLNGESVLEIINWAYIKSLKINDEKVKHILDSAIHLKINIIAKQCVDHICSHLTYSNCAINYASFVNYTNFFLNNKITKYIIFNFYSLMNGAYLDNLPPMDVVHIASDDKIVFLNNNALELVASDQENHLFQIIKNYLQQNKKFDFWLEFLTKSIRLGFLADDQLQNMIDNKSWLGSCKDADKCIRLLKRLIKDKQNNVPMLKFPIWSQPRNWTYGFTYAWSKVKTFLDMKQIVCDDVNSEQLLKLPTSPFIVVKQITIWHTFSTFPNLVEGMEVTYNSGNTYKHGNTSEGLERTSSTINLQEDEFINKIDFKYSREYIDSLTFHTSLGHTFGPYGGDGGREGQSKPLEPGGFLAGIRTQVFGRNKPDIMSSIEFCWGNVYSKYISN